MEWSGGGAGCWSGRVRQLHSSAVNSHSDPAFADPAASRSIAISPSRRQQWRGPTAERCNSLPPTPGRMEVLPIAAPGLTWFAWRTRSRLLSVRGERWLGLRRRGRTSASCYGPANVTSCVCRNSESAQAAVLLMPMAEPVLGRPAQ